MSAPIYTTPTPAPDNVTEVFTIPTYEPGSVQVWFNEGLQTKAGAVTELDAVAGTFRFVTANGAATIFDALRVRYVDPTIPDDQVSGDITIILSGPISLELIDEPIEVTLERSAIVIDAPLLVEVLVVNRPIIVELCC